MATIKPRKPISFSGAQQKIKQKTLALFSNYELPHNWLILFVHDNKKFKGFENDLRNYKNGKSSPSQDVLAVLSRWVKKNGVKKVLPVQPPDIQ